MRKLRNNIYGIKSGRSRFIRGNEEDAPVMSRESWERKFHRLSAGFLPKAELMEIVEEVSKMNLSDERKYKVARDIMFEKAYA